MLARIVWMGAPETAPRATSRTLGSTTRFDFSQYGLGRGSGKMGNGAGPAVYAVTP